MERLMLGFRRVRGTGRKGNAPRVRCMVCFAAGQPGEVLRHVTPCPEARAS